MGKKKVDEVKEVEAEYEDYAEEVIEKVEEAPKINKKRENRT